MNIIVNPGVDVPAHEDILINILARLDLDYLYRHYYKPYYSVLNTKKALY